MIAGISARFSNFAFVLFCYITNHLLIMAGPQGNSEFCFPRISMFPETKFNVNYNCRWIIGVLAQSCLNALLECGLFLPNYLQSSGMKNVQTVNQTMVNAPLMVPLVISCHTLLHRLDV